MARKAKKVAAGSFSALRTLEERRQFAHRQWCARHPQMAAEQRALRLARREAVDRWGHKLHGTVETLAHASRTRQGALLRLYQSGAISIDQLGAAQEIAAEAERIGAQAGVRTVSFETRVDQSRSGDGTFFEALGRVRREMAYSRWRAALPGGTAAMVLDMIVGDIGVTIAARRYRMHVRRAKQLLIAALDAWADMIRDVAREVDEATLLAAQAAIL